MEEDSLLIQQYSLLILCGLHWFPPPPQYNPCTGIRPGTIQVPRSQVNRHKLICTCLCATGRAGSGVLDLGGSSGYALTPLPPTHPPWLSHVCLQALHLAQVQEGEHAQQADHVHVGHGEEVLVELGVGWGGGGGRVGVHAYMPVVWPGEHQGRTKVIVIKGQDCN